MVMKGGLWRAPGVLDRKNARASQNRQQIMNAQCPALLRPMVLQVLVGFLGAFTTPLSKVVPAALPLAPRELELLNSWEITAQKLARYLSPALSGLLLPVCPFGSLGLLLLLLGFHATSCGKEH